MAVSEMAVSFFKYMLFLFYKKEFLHLQHDCHQWDRGRNPDTATH
jgi:hypothetical protein